MYCFHSTPHWTLILSQNDLTLGHIMDLLHPSLLAIE